ncbi:GM12501 [Drosophila sechellia]|uniref:GM12501 n=1 Tax=Drosophila sechellia TaxID=7238 RepID=B4I094_DROSE|nr:GM12501 [Drosophila sechellia]
MAGQQLLSPRLFPNSPKTLYDLSLEALIGSMNTKIPALDRINRLSELPRNLLIDVYEMMSQEESLKDTLLEELAQLEVFSRLVRYPFARSQLLRIMASLMASNKMLAKRLSENYVSRYERRANPDKLEAINDSYLEELSAVELQIIDLGLRSDRFSRRLDGCRRALPCWHALILLYAESAHCNFKEAHKTYVELMGLNKWLNRNVPHQLVAITYSQISAMYFARNEYKNSHLWSGLAMRFLKGIANPRIIVDVLRQAAKACVVKRDFARANLLICQAVRRAREYFGPKHQKYGDALLDYGFFLLNVDSVFQSVYIYKEALAVRRGIFGNMNFHVAIAHEDLSYAYYVHEYSTGDFSCAQDHVDKAVNIMQHLVPSNHLMLASAKRVKALLLEEIALDKMADGIDEEDLLLQSEELHNFALILSLQVFGEVNVQTAKHYGNLGRLYQTMNRFEEAERMHKKAIKIKSELLGHFDYEVGLSIGHLASLYNYQMKKYRDAEQLYMRSIDISLRLFGNSYSGLEYDYLGLCHVYETLHNFEKYLKYANKLENWQLLRGQNITQNKSSYPAIEVDYSIEEVKTKYFSMCAFNKSGHYSVHAEDTYQN